MGIPMVPAVFRTKLMCKSYQRFKTWKKKGYLHGIREFGGSEDTYPPIFNACEHDGVKTSLMAIAIYEI
jgi:hypothetical protein